LESARRGETFLRHEHDRRVGQRFSIEGDLPGDLGHREASAAAGHHDGEDENCDGGEAGSAKGAKKSAPVHDSNA
jgi:hypothetical protein